jgi:hypothetical protein
MPIFEEKLKRLAEQLPDASRDPQAVRTRVEAMEKMLERAFVIPGINRPVGADWIVGLVPVVGLYRLGSPQPWHVEAAAYPYGGQCRH